MRAQRATWPADAAALVGVWAFVSFLSTAQRWTWLNTPDAEFYASLGLFGHEVTDRTVTPAYYWTRLGTIAPVRFLTELLGPWAGYYVVWLILIALVVSAVFLTVRRISTRFMASLMALFVALNTVVLSFLGSPYVTGTAMTAMFVALAATAWSLPLDGDAAVVPGPGPRFVGPVITGLALGWLAMTNPNATLMTVAMWVAATVVITIHRRRHRLRELLVGVGLAAMGAVASFLLLLGAGAAIFPGLNWVETTLFWSKALDLSGYVSDQWAFLRDISMVVPLVLMVLVLLVLVIRPRDPVTHLAAVLSPVGFGLTLLIVLLRPNGTLEVGHYQALQWPPALLGLALIVATVASRRAASPWTVAAGGVGVLATVLAGHWDGTMSLSSGWLIAIASAAAFLATVAWASRAAGESRQRTAQSVLALVCATGLLMASFQLLQNARRPTGVMAEGVYSNAYNANDSAARLESAHDAERWLIENTEPSDTVMVWVDADWASGEQTLLSMAAFQIWGINQVTPERTMEGAGVGNARNANANVIAMYGKSMDAIVSFWSSIPREIGHSDPLCSDYPWPDPAAPTAYLCLTRLTWP